MKLVSHLTPDFWPGLRVLAHSLSNRGGIRGLDWIIMTETGEVPDEWYWWLGACGFNLISKAYFDIGANFWPKAFPATKERLVINWNKLRVFLLPPGEYLYLDTDILCMRDATALLEMPAISGCPQMVNRPEYPGIELGLVRIDASLDMFNKCMAAAYTREHWPAAEQSVLAAVYETCPERFHVLDYRFDMLNYLAIRAPDLWKPDEAIFLHFAGDVKPWNGFRGQANIVPWNLQGVWNKVSNIWRDYDATF